MNIFVSLQHFLYIWMQQVLSNGVVWVTVFAFQMLSGSTCDFSLCPTMIWLVLQNNLPVV